LTKLSNETTGEKEILFDSSHPNNLVRIVTKQRSANLSSVQQQLKGKVTLLDGPMVIV